MIPESEFRIIAGPCAAESREQMLVSAQEALSRGIETVRMSLWKPRTRPGFDGMGEEGIPVLLEVTELGIQPATEVLFPRHAEAVMEGTLGKRDNARILLWLGSRNQNHTIQHDIGRVISGEPRVTLMIKNQMWKDQAHWEGIVDHVLAGGASPQQLLLCHRGFAPAENGMRNPPDFDLSLELKHRLSEHLGINIPMIVDPSHIAGGSPANVIEVAQRAARHRHRVNGTILRFDGMIVEVHPNPEQAITDKQQQLLWPQLDELLLTCKANGPPELEVGIC